MGEYAEYQGERVKIGTCEQMYYLRADQADQVRALPGNVDPIDDRYGIRFRFPFPDEDGRAPGDVDGPEHNFDRTFRIDGVPSAGVDHYSVQFKAGNGYLLSIPCPEQGTRNVDRMSIELDGLKIGLNGYGGSFGIHSQKWVEADEDGPERLVTVCRCHGCGALWRLHSWEMAEPIVIALRSQADDYQRREESSMPVYGPSPKTLHTIADRITAGYNRVEVTI
jgi:hypothetical protein